MDNNNVVTSNDFLVEIGTEELPPKTLKTLAGAFTRGIETGLADAGLTYTRAHSYATPRRLAVRVERLAQQTPQKEVLVWGPPAKVAFDTDGKVTKAAEAFARKNGIDAANLVVENDGKADKLVHRASAGGEAAMALVGPIVEAALAALPIAKRMRWGAHRTEFVRPVHWLLMLMGDQVVNAEALGLKAGRDSRGHRFHCDQALTIAKPDDYVEQLRSPGRVLVDFTERQALIRQQVEAAATQVGGTAVIDAALLDEVTALVEWPQALTGQFEQRFLEVPPEALIASMKEHQKYFHLVDAEDQLLPYFIAVANIESRDPAQVIDGNERVIRPRLADAAFFFDTDKKTTLEQRRERLQPIVFQARLGSLYDKTERIETLAAAIAEQIDADVALARRAAQLCKADLVTDMVGEFDKMQGVAGYYYALNDGEPEAVALALKEQYLPKFAGDGLPATTTGTVLALADRIDTLAGIFGIGQKPTGSKDPFGLRRASLAVLRLLVEKQLNLDLAQLLHQAALGYGDNIEDPDSTTSTALDYMLERFRAWYEEAQIPAEVFLAVSAKRLTVPLDIDNRVRAVDRFRQLPEAEALAAANKRVSNILTKQGAGGSRRLQSNLLQEDAEQALAAALAQKGDIVAPLFANGRYTEALESLADLRDPVDRFFDQVMVMAEDPQLRDNRLALLEQLRQLFLEVADISLLAPAKG
ncbi:glycine--tRNA ligase subunit beta [Exilibacterium tricleocarpae]|uniref:Glycine--tRNA ligase beta subunit n=1 Tax=Exilibacterium tricleocarpae TaxID=2591008 RepID=A0A545T0F7_9GAMM|nr:glycine--tRNA ligase subunit beta [Exilibacterium tricleocarpae]TQV70681.1 glycine--tRNA ligase subunit beta [Exilibacterium tricleocarpae]